MVGARVSRLVEEIGGALMAAHAAAVLHNDVRAANILLDDDGAAYLGDFGIALSVDTCAANATEANDVRGFGRLIWELLAGTPPPEGAAPLPSLIGRAGALPEGLDAVLARAAAIRDGFPTVADFVLAWRAATGRAARAEWPSISEERRSSDSGRRLAARQLSRSAVAGVNPYLGLRAFDEADAHHFFGRDGAADQVAHLVRAHRLVTVVGPSGSGKSSLVRAGVVPLLREQGFVTVTMVPGTDPMMALQEALSSVAVTADVGGLGGPLDLLLDVAERFVHVVVIVDQFEECWTRSDERGRNDFVRLIVDTIASPTLDVRFVATVRADLLDGPLGHAELGQDVGAGAYVLPPLSPVQLDEAIALPAAKVGVAFDDGVVAALVAEAVTSPASLPLLQFTLTELYDQRVDGVIGRSSLDTVGGLAGAIGRRAEDVFVGLDDLGRRDARELFARLVSPSPDGLASRRRARRGELSPGMSSVADRYVAARLLVTDRDPMTREPTVEVAHEALFARWSRLVGWIEEDRRWLLQLEHLTSAARAWDEAGRGQGELYRGARLEASIDAIERDGRAVSTVERAFVEAGRAARDAEVVAARDTARRLRRRLTAVACTLAVAVLAGAIAFVQRRSALDAADAARDAERAAEIEALVGRAEAMRATQRDVAALLALQAFELADTPRTRSALLTTAAGDDGYLDTHVLHELGEQSPYGSPFVPRSTSGDYIFTLDEPNEVARTGIVLPDGKHAFVSGFDGLARPYDLESGEVGDPLEPVTDDLEPINGGIFAGSDGAAFAHLVPDATRGAHVAAVYDAERGEMVSTAFDIGGYALAAVLTPDGSTLVVSMLDSGTIRVFDAPSGRLRGELPLPPEASTDVRFGFGVGLAVVDDHTVLAGSASGAVRLVDLDDVVATWGIEVGHNVTHTMRPSRDGDAIIGSGPDGVVRIDVEAQDVAWEVREPESCWSLAVVDEADAIYCGDHYGRIDVRDPETGARRGSLSGQNGNVGALWPANGGTELVSFANNEPVVSRWRLDGSGPVTRVARRGWSTLTIGPDGVTMLAFQPLMDGRRLHRVYDIEPKLLDIVTGDDLGSVRGLYAPVWAGAGTLAGLAASEVGAHLASYDIRSGELVVDDDLFDVDRALLPSADPGKERVLLGFRGGRPDQAELVAVEDGRYVGPTIVVDEFTFMTISSSGHRVVAATRHGIESYDGATGELLGVIPGADTRVAFLTVADQLFVGSLGGELVQYDLETLQPIRSFDGSGGAVQELYGTLDGSMIAVRGGDGIVTLHDVDTGVRVGPAFAMGPEDQLQMSMSLDGRTLAYGGGLDGPIRLVDLEVDSWAEAACDIAGRNLSREEWDTYIGDLAAYRPICAEFPLP